ncbi:MAG: hypothetical protein QM499_05130 [Flavobacteriaceae bacterium]
MKTFLKYIIIFIILLNTVLGFGQDIDEILQNSINTMQNKEAYQVNTDYKLYKGLDDSKVYEEYDGILSKKGTSMYQKLGAMELLKEDSFFVKLNHDDKEILIDLSTDSIPTDLTSMDISLVLQFFEKGEITNMGNYYKLEFTGKPNNKLMISRLILHIEKATHYIKKQIIFLSYLSDFSAYDSQTLKKDFDKARLEISFSKFKDEIDENNFKKERYFSIINNKIIIGNEFKKFKLIPTN